MPLLDDLGDLGQEHVELRARVGQLGRVDQRRVAGRLSEAEEGFQDLDLRPVQLGGLLAEERRAVVGAELFVDGTLGRLHVAVEGLLGLLREVLHDLRLGPPEDERPQRAGEELALPLVGRAGPGGVPLEDRVGAEHPGVEELEDRPELAQVVLDRRAAHRQPVPRPDEPGGLRGLALGVLDRLRLVEDHVVELDVRQLGDVGPEGPISGDDQVVVAELLAERVAARPGVVEDPEPRGELRGLLDPVEHERTRDDREGGALRRPAAPPARCGGRRGPELVLPRPMSSARMPPNPNFWR